MAGFNTKTFIKHDDYMTPKHAWENIAHLIPKDKILWECFYGDGKSGEYLKELNFNVIHKPVDFFINNLGDIIISNPPFSQSKQVMKRLAELDKPFIIILPASKLFTSYVRDNFKNKELKIIIPRKRIHFKKLVGGKIPENYKSCCNFDCLYYCYKINLPSDILWLE